MPGAAHVISEYKDLLARTETLIREFQPSLSAGTVITTVRSCRNELMRTGVRASRSPPRPWPPHAPSRYDELNRSGLQTARRPIHLKA